MRLTAILTFVCFTTLGSLAACDDGEPHSPAAQADSSTDSTAGGDGSTNPDAGQPDASPTPDVNPVEDTTTQPDAAPVEDSSTQPDAAPVEDTSTQPDAPVEDASTEPDAPVEDASTEPDALVEDASTEPDAPVEDASTEPDAPVEDASTEPDAPVEDATTEPDAPVEDASSEPDAPVEDATTEPDAPVEDATTEPDAPAEDTSTQPDAVPPGEPIDDDVRNYIFGHSLILHSPVANVPRWLHALSQHAGYSYGMSGQYGFADTHAGNLPPFAQWGVPDVPSVWDDDTGISFEDTNFDTILFTEANFRQYYPPTEPDPDGFLSTSTVDATITVFDWVHAAEPTGVRYVIYENWPDMAGYTNADFQGSFPSANELDAYHTYTMGAFHDWWVDYHDAMMAQRPGLNVRIIPVGSVMAQLLTGTLAGIPAQALYEDDAPHGQPTLYFIAGVITYMGLYGVPAPDDFVIPNDIDAGVVALYPQIVSEAWAALESFVDADGNNRVW